MTTKGKYEHAPRPEHRDYHKREACKFHVRPVPKLWPVPPK